MKRLSAVALSIFLALAAVIVPTQALAPAQTFEADVKTWLTRYNDPASYYVKFPNGLIVNGGSWTRTASQYALKDWVFLWHCGMLPTPFSIKDDAHLFLRGKIVQYLDDGGSELAGEYKTQCQLGTYSGDLRVHMAAQ